MIYHVSINGADGNDGIRAPFRHINYAAGIAQEGDTVVIHEGVYREWVDPRCSGVTYEAAPGEHPIIKGSEVVSDWARVKDTVWEARIPNTLFGDWNPYSRKVEGDWMYKPDTYDVHLGDVYLNGRSMYEASSLEDLYEAPMRYQGFQYLIEPEIEPIHDPQYTVYRWYAQVEEEYTRILCNFHEFDPNRELVEIHVRKCCFYPTTPGIDRITVRGLEMAQAACPFAPPTAEQIGMVGVNWGHGWLIENNRFHDAKCSALSIGKNADTGNNEAYYRRVKHSHYYQIESVFLGLQQGWEKGKVGSHVIRNNVIYDCGQNGIVGHMGGAFCVIEHNHIYNIGVKHEFYGAEIAGIKLHAAVDAVLENNNIHDCTRGMWLDWQAQGVRVTRNVFHNNDVSDLMIEVSHGPCTVDNNLFLSKHNVENMTQGTAFVHNLFVGNFRFLPCPADRQTPYHFPHSTQVRGVARLFGGDDRLFNNIMLGVYPSNDPRFQPPSAIFNIHRTPDYYKVRMDALSLLDRNPILPVYIENNAYAGMSGPFRAEVDPIHVDGMTVDLHEHDGVWELTLRVPSALFASCPPVTTARLGQVIFPEQPFTDAEDRDLDFTADMLGQMRESIYAGPLGQLKEGEQTIAVWS